MTGTPTATPIFTRPPSTSPPACSNASVLARWDVQQLAAQTIVVPADENNVAAVQDEVASGAGGVILFGSSAPAGLGTQLRALVAHAPHGIAPLVMTDEEGGVVQRMANLVGFIPSARAMAATMSDSAIQQLAQQAAVRMRAAGITTDLAPVLDLDGGSGPNNDDADGTRSFSTDPGVASTDGRAFAAGLQTGGVMPVIKHFPGLGDASGNTDVKPAATQPWSALQQRGLIPFRDAVSAGIPAVMIANASVPGLTAQPASISSAVIQGVLRGQLGFRGLILTDSLSAGAFSQIGYSVPRAAVAALLAGADMVLYNAAANSTAVVMREVVSAVASAVQNGTLSRAALAAEVLHVLAAKHVNLCAA